MRSALVPILLADPLPWAQKAEYAWDFLRDRARFGGRYRGVLANTPGWTFTRASTGYYTTTGGVLVPFASGSLRTGDRGALIEGAGTNLCLQSQTFDNASWTKSGNGVATAPSVTANYAVAPDGTSTADRVQFALNGGTSTSDSSVIQQNFTVSNTTAYTVSVWLKSNTGSSYSMSLMDPSATRQNITVTPTWQRFTYTATTISTAYALIVRLRGGLSPADSDSADISFWGAQLEQASFPSSYIPTTTASATRAADSLTVTGVTGLDYPLTLFAEFERAADKDAAEPHFGVSNTTNDYALLRTSSGDLSQGAVVTGGVSQGFPAVGSLVMAVGTAYKHAMRVATNDLQIALNGTLGTPDASSTNPAAPTMIEFGSLGGSYGHTYLRRAAIYASAKSNAQLTALTT